MSFTKQIKAKYRIIAETFITPGNVIAPQQPEELGLPKLEVKSDGKTVYKPRFTIAENKPELVIQFGHYWGGGSYYVSTLLKSSGGLNLYGADERPDALISAEEMNKLRDYLKKNKEKLAEAIKQKVASV